MYLFCKPKLLRVYKADPALKVQEFKEKHALLAFGCVSLLWDFAGLLVCFEGIMHSEAFCSVSPLYSNKGMFLVSTAYSKTIKSRHCWELIFSIVPIILPIQRCLFSSSFKPSRRAHLNLYTRTVLYRQGTNHWITEAHMIAFGLLYSKRENCPIQGDCSRLKSQLSKGGGPCYKLDGQHQNSPRKVAWCHMPAEPR